MASTKVQRIMTQPVNPIFRFLQSVSLSPPYPPAPFFSFPPFPHARGFADLVSSARAEGARKDMRIEGRIIVSGF